MIARSPLNHDLRWQTTRPRYPSPGAIATANSVRRDLLDVHGYARFVESCARQANSAIAEPLLPILLARSVRGHQVVGMTH